MPLDVPDNALQAMFMRAWTTEGFADDVATDPHRALADAGLAVSQDVQVTAFGFRGEHEHLCLNCQLAIPGVFITVARSASCDSLSALDRLFASDRDAEMRSRAAESPREILRAFGFELTNNVRVRMRFDEPISSLELQLCAAFHACLCDEPELEPIVFAHWHE